MTSAACMDTYAAGDKLHSVHEAQNADAVYRDAEEGGFPADLVAELRNTFGRETAKGTA
jgi:hypothetical protein